MTGDDLIFLASNLVVNSALGNAESRYRSAISRAYYGAFHLSMAFLKELNERDELSGINLRVPENHEAHERVYRILFASNVPELIEVARHLNDLRSDRNKADYKLGARGFDSMPNARDKVEMAATVQRLISSCRIEAKVKEIVSSILNGR